MPVIAIANQKGGVAKTMVTLNMGAEMARRGMRVLLVDADPQGSLTHTFGVDDPDRNLSTVLGVVDRGSGHLASIVREVGDGLALAPSDIMLSRTELALVVRPAREYQLRRAIDPLRADYDFILIDCPPSLGLLAVNCLLAADGVLVPTLLDVVSFRALGALLQTLADIRADYEHAPRLLGVLATMADMRSVHAREVLAALRSRPDLHVFETIIPRSIKFSEAAFARQALGDYDARHPGAQAFRDLTEEVIERAKQTTP